MLESESSEDSCQEAEDASDIEWEEESWPNAMVEEEEDSHSSDGEEDA